MNNDDTQNFRNVEIPAIMNDIGLSQQFPNIMIYDSLHYRSDFIRKKPFRSRHFSVLLVLKGSMKVKVNLFEYELTEKDVLIIPPTAIRHMLWKKDEVHFISLLFTAEFLSEAGILGRYFNIADIFREGLASYRKVTESDHNVLLQIMQIIQILLKQDVYNNTDDEVIRNLFRAVLLKIKQYYDDITIDKELSAAVVYRFIKLLSENYLVHREVTFYAEKLNINEKYLTQLLKRKTGKTARQYIIDMVILEAKVLLNENAFSVKEIANKLNFVNLFHFSRFFKQYAELSPTQYRNQE